MTSDVQTLTQYRDIGCHAFDCAQAITAEPCELRIGFMALALALALAMGWIQELEKALETAQVLAKEMDLELETETVQELDSGTVKVLVLVLVLAKEMALALVMDSLKETATELESAKVLV